MSISALLMLIITYFYIKTSYGGSPNIPFEKLKEKGWKVFLNTYNCGWCAKQVNFLGGNLDKVEVVHCDNILNTDCKSIKALPMWVDKDGNEVPGALLSSENMVKKLGL
tara:strand:+ start:2133 stop:2459 length:327 start_codon:yes stop_codon:yes gene_type:complete